MIVNVIKLTCFLCVHLYKGEITLVGISQASYELLANILFVVVLNQDACTIKLFTAVIYGS